MQRTREIQKVVTRENFPTGKNTPLTGENSRAGNGLRYWRKFVGSTIAGDTVLNQDFKEFIQSLNDNAVRYLLVGGYAVALHGYPRYTKDLHIWVERTAENAAQMIKALQ